MSTERHFPLTEEQIFAAERQRATGNIAEAAQATQPAIEFPLDNFSQLPEDDKKRLLMAARINVVANTSSANRSWEAPTVAYYLGETKKGIVTVYRNPDVQEAANTIKVDTRGNPYEFRTEMAGDEVEYTITLAALTGNTSLLDEAVDRMNLIIEGAGEPTAKTLAQFRQARLRHQSNPSAENFDTLKQSYVEATRASADINRWKRVATIASRYTIDSIASGHPVEASKGFATHVRAASKDHSTAGIFLREVARAVTESARQRNWRKTTPPEADYLDLRLPKLSQT